jgi:hypothetical protein
MIGRINGELLPLLCPQTDKHLATPDLNVVFPYDEAHAKAGLLAR